MGRGTRPKTMFSLGQAEGFVSMMPPALPHRENVARRTVYNWTLAWSQMSAG